MFKTNLNRPGPLDKKSALGAACVRSSLGQSHCSRLLAETRGRQIQQSCLGQAIIARQEGHTSLTAAAGNSHIARGTYTDELARAGLLLMGFAPQG